MVTAEYREELLKEYTEAARIFTELMNEEACTSTNFILFKLLSDINDSLKSINDQLNRIGNNIINLTN